MDPFIYYLFFFVYLFFYFPLFSGLTDNEDEQCAKCISDKLGNTSGISYTEIASKALDKGRTALAIKLLDFEPRADNQVRSCTGNMR